MKSDTGSGYASKGVNFLRMGARPDTHQKLSTFQGLICIEKCQLSKKMDTHYTHYASKSVNFPREISTKSVFAELVYQKKTAVTLRASHRWEEDGSGKDDTHHPLASTHWGSGTAPPYPSTNLDVVGENEPHAASVLETCVAIEPLRARLREVHPASTSRFGTSSPPHSQHIRTRRAAIPPRCQKCAAVPTIPIGSPLPNASSQITPAGPARQGRRAWDT
jgi:hypothetical protein